MLTFFEQLNAYIKKSITFIVVLIFDEEDEKNSTDSAAMSF